jgi:HD superfamily phosphodiesterase
LPIAIGGISVPDSKLAREIAELVRDTESPLLFHHSSRVFYWGGLTGVRRGVTFDAELLDAGAMFHDMGLTYRHSSPNERFEVDGANAARDFLRGHGISRQDIDNRAAPAAPPTRTAQHHCAINRGGSTRACARVQRRRDRGPAQSQ